MGLQVSVVALAVLVFAAAAIVAAVLVTVAFPEPLDEAPRELRLDEHLLELARWKEHTRDVN
jgi:hypothetical protein